MPRSDRRKTPSPCSPVSWQCFCMSTQLCAQLDHWSLTCLDSEPRSYQQCPLVTCCDVTPSAHTLWGVSVFRTKAAMTLWNTTQPRDVENIRHSPRMWFWICFWLLCIQKLFAALPHLVSGSESVVYWIWNHLRVERLGKPVGIILFASAEVGGATHCGWSHFVPRIRK